MKEIDFEAIALGQPQAVPQEMVIRNDHLVIAAGESVIASRLPNSPEYNFILRIMEGEIEKLETEHMREWKNKELFERTGLIAVAARSFFERFQVEINHHSSEYIGEQEADQIEKEVEEMSPEEFIRRGFGIE